MRARCILSFLFVFFTATAIVGGNADSDPGSTIPKADVEKWAKRVRKFTPPGWTVSTRQNDIIIQRDKPLRFVPVSPPGMPAAVPGQKSQPTLHEDVFRWRLRLLPKMSMDEHEKRARHNAKSEQERDRLRQRLREVGLSSKGDDQFGETTPEQKKHVQSYREAVKQLTWHTLPDLYTPDHSIHLFYSRGRWPYDKEVATECRDVEQRLFRYFGIYNADHVVDPGIVGRPEPLPDRR